MSNLKWRLALIGVLVLASAWALFPRNVKVRQRRADGTFFDTTAVPNFANGGAPFTDARTVSPARPRSFYAGLKATF